MELEGEGVPYERAITIDPLPYQRVNAVKFNEYAFVVVSAGYNHSVCTWIADLTVLSQLRLLFIIDTFTDIVMPICLTKTIIIAERVDGTVRTFDIRQGREISDDWSQLVNCISMSNDGNCILASCLDFTLRHLDMCSGKLLQEYKGHTCKVSFYLLPSAIKNENSWEEVVNNRFPREIGERNFRPRFNSWSILNLELARYRIPTNSASSSETTTTKETIGNKGKKEYVMKPVQQKGKVMHEKVNELNKNIVSSNNNVEGANMDHIYIDDAKCNDHNNSNDDKGNDDEENDDSGSDNRD
ncbi:hypothetical protein GIB67_016360 [Kingdonia uniflora]|uniref:Uncharacterized protein n=1 Tax=Kingdonia uniflora TaxID=39325 RepID=A0A7J7M9X1_9MAGN|nr:hypothetical protein GIB67_016360 [Kingdonia uniflora]